MSAGRYAASSTSPGSHAGWSYAEDETNSVASAEPPAYPDVLSSTRMLASSTLTGRCRFCRCGKGLPWHAGREHRRADRAVAGRAAAIHWLRALQHAYAASAFGMLVVWCNRQEVATRAAAWHAEPNGEVVS
jgi:hypothetical protein